MKVYRVVYSTGEVRSFWTSYRSAVGSAAQARDEAVVQVAHIPDEVWKPVDKANQSRLTRLENLWGYLDNADAEEVVRSLTKQLTRRRNVVPPSLAERERLEAQALLALDRLVDAA